MEFSIEVVKKMAEIMAKEMGQILPAPKDIREVETGMRELLQKVGAEGLKRYLEQADQAEPQEKETECECQGKQRYLFRRKAVILSVFGRVSYKRRYHVCNECGRGQSPLDKRLHIAAGEVTAGLAELLALAGVETAFAESSRLIERFLLFRVSDNTLRKETERFGELQKAREEKWKRQSQDESWLQERLQTYGKRSGRLYGSIDGENKLPVSVSNERVLDGLKSALSLPPKPGPPGSAINGIIWPTVGLFYHWPSNNF